MNAGRAGHDRIRTSASTLVPTVALVLRGQRYRGLALVLFLGILGFYLVTLPSTYTGGAVGFLALRYLTGDLAACSAVLAALLSLTITVNVYGFRTSARQRGAVLSVGAVLASVVPSSVCCTSLVPSVLAALGGSTVQIFGLAGRIQGGIARFQMVSLVTAIVLLLLSLYLAASTVATSCTLTRKGGRLDATKEPAQV